MEKHVILDTDIGGDPDDALALLFGLNSPEIQLDLIVTSNEHKGHRLNFAKKLLKKLGKKVPVVMGKDLGKPEYCFLDDLVTDRTSDTNYLEAIRRVVENNTKTYYVCTGPQSNLAAFLDYEPKPISKMETVLMSGAINIKPKKVSYNIRRDLDAAKKIFSSDLDMRSVLTDITKNPAIKVDLNHPLYEEIKKSSSPVRDLLLWNFKTYFERAVPYSYMHDPLTLSYVIDPRFLTFEEKRVEMEYDGLLKISENGRLLKVSTHAKYEEFMEFFSNRVI